MINKPTLSYAEMINQLGIASVVSEPELQSRLIDGDDIGNLVRTIEYCDRVQSDFHMMEPDNRGEEYYRYQSAVTAHNHSYSQLRGFILNTVLSGLSSKDYAERLRATLEFFKSWRKD
jgi:hypothetical protein